MSDQAELNFGFSKPSDLLKKIRRDSKKLDREASPDNIFNFVITAYHLLDDWIRRNKDPDIHRGAKQDITEKQGRKNEINVFNICRDLSIGSKHFVLDKKSKEKKVITNIKIYEAGFGNSRFGKVPFGGTEPMVELDAEGVVYDIHSLRKEIMDFCGELFRKYKIP